MKSDISNFWQPISLGEHVGCEVPLRVCVGTEDIVLFRDRNNYVRALEDRCPHRRVPLSLGKVIKGELRCAYHGWTFDGKSGACTQIPNLSDAEQVPSRYKVTAHITEEANGFVFLWRGIKPPTKTNQYPAFAEDETLPIFGSVTVPLDAAAYRMAMLDGPETLFGFHGIGFTDFFLGNAVKREHKISIDRAAAWLQKGKPPSKWDRDYPFILRTAASLRDGTVEQTLIDEKDQCIARIYMGVIPGPRGTTKIVWRGYLNPDHPAARTINRGKPPIQLFSRLDGLAIADLIVGPSKTYLEAI